MNKNISGENLKKIINQRYILEQCRYLYKRVHPAEKTNNDKNFYTNWFGEVLQNKDDLSILLKTFSASETDILNKIIFEETEVDIRKLCEKYKFSSNFYFYTSKFFSESKGEFSFFIIEGLHLKLPPEIINFVLNCIDIPEKYKLKNHAEPQTTEYSYNNEQNILRNIKNYLKFIELSSLNTVEYSDKMFLKKQITDFKNFCEINYILPDADCDKECKMILKFIHDNTNKQIFASKDETAPHDIIKRLCDNFFNSKFAFLNNNQLELKIFLDYFSVSQSRYMAAFNFYRIEFYKIMKLISQMEWVNIDNLILSCPSNNILINSNGINNYFYNDYWRLKDKHSITGNYYYTKPEKKYTVNLPIIKSYFQLMAFFGLIEARYDKPKNPVEKFAKLEYLTYFDNLKFLKITELGKYAIGAKKNYESLNESESYRMNISLSPDVLVATVDAANNLAKIILREFGEQIGENSFKFNYRYFFKNSKNFSDIKAKYSRLKELFKEIKMHDNWKKFLQNLENRILSITMFDKMIVYNLPDNRDLINLFINDQRIKKIILKVENNKFAIKKDNIPALLKIVSEAGFWIDFEKLI